METYSNTLRPMNGKSMWPKTMYAKLLPPDVKRRAGRPKKARRRESDEEPKPTKFMTCKQGGQVGHNKRTCKKANGGMTSVDATSIAKLPASLIKNTKSSI